MRRFAAAALWAALAVPAGAQDPKAEEGFAPLFNGKDLVGWVYGKKAGGENKTGAGYVIENGTIVCTDKDNGALYTEKEYGDFVLRFEFKLAANAVNGLALRAPLEGDSAYVGLDIQILDDAGPEFRNLRPEQYSGSLYDVFPARRGALKPAGEWNAEEITAQGRRLTVRLNGQTVLDVSLDDCKDEVTLKKHPGLKNAKGHLGLLGHATRVEFRNLRVKEL